MKKCLLFILTALLLTGCANGKETKEKATESPAPTETGLVKETAEPERDSEKNNEYLNSLDRKGEELSDDNGNTIQQKVSEIAAGYEKKAIISSGELARAVMPADDFWSSKNKNFPEMIYLFPVNSGLNIRIIRQLSNVETLKYVSESKINTVLDIARKIGSVYTNYDIDNLDNYEELYKYYKDGANEQQVEYEIEGLKAQIQSTNESMEGGFLADKTTVYIDAGNYYRVRGAFIYRTFTGKNKQGAKWKQQVVELWIKKVTPVDLPWVVGNYVCDRVTKFMEPIEIEDSEVEKLEKNAGLKIASWYELNE